MPGKSLRVFAGPNGSGKSTLFEEIKALNNINLGYFINADNLESQLKNKGFIDLNSIGVKSDQNELAAFLGTVQARSLIDKAKEEGYNINIELVDNVIVDKSRDTMSYEASLIAFFIRDLLYKQNKTFSFETVMSHFSKVEELSIAKLDGYRIYLYFICTDDPEINISRVEDRVGKGGHDVNPVNIRNRYPKALENLYPAIQQSRRAFLFDNSGKGGFKLIAETFENAIKLHVASPPVWFLNYVLPNYHS
jgi:predicted ABC-type ATPase